MLSPGQDAVGIDLDVKTTATCSGGDKLESGRFYRDLEKALGVVIRLMWEIHAKIANHPKDALHIFSRALVYIAE